MTQVDTTQEQEQEQEVKHGVALVPYQQKQVVAPIHGLEIAQDMTFEEKLALHREVSSKIDGDSEHADKYLNRTLHVAEVYQHDSIVNTSKKSGKYAADGKAIYDDAVRTVIHVVGIDGRRLSEVKKISFSGISVSRYFSTRIIPLFGVKFEQAIPFIFTKLESGAYSITTPEE